MAFDATIYENRPSDAAYITYQFAPHWWPSPAGVDELSATVELVLAHVSHLGPKSLDFTGLGAAEVHPEHLAVTLRALVPWRDEVPGWFEAANVCAAACLRQRLTPEDVMFGLPFDLTATRAPDPSLARDRYRAALQEIVQLAPRSPAGRIAAQALGVVPVPAALGKTRYLDGPASVPGAPARSLRSSRGQPTNLATAGLSTTPRD